MHQGRFAELLLAIKQVMKARRITYAQLAEHLDVSEATIKRFFISKDSSYLRIQQICDVLNLPLIDLLSLAQEQKEKVFSLTMEQEEFFSKNQNYFAFFQELVEGGLSPKEIQKKYKLSIRSLQKYLKKLETLKILEWLPSDKARLKYSGSHSFIDGGPLQKKYLQDDSRLFMSYLQASFLKENHFLTTSDRHIHPETFKAYIAELKSITSSYRKKSYRDEIYYSKNELLRVKWIVGLAPYVRDMAGSIANIDG